MFVTTLELEDLSDNKILIKLPRNNLFKIHNFYLLSEWSTNRSGSINTLSIYVDVEDKEKASKDIRFMIDLLNFMYNIDLTITSSYMISETKNLPMTKWVHSNETKNKNIIKINNALTLLFEMEPKKQKLIKKSLHYYSRSLKLSELELYEEAFLSVYKPIKLISNNIYKNHHQKDFNDAISSVIPNLLKELFDEEFKEEGKDNDINNLIVPMLEGILTQRRKIKNTLLFLKLEREVDYCGKLVRLRNNAASHGNSRNSNIGIYEYVNCMILSKEIITAYLLGEKSDLTQLVVKRKD